MATLSAGDRAACSAELQRELSDARAALGALTKDQYRAAVDAADQWASDNAASFNSALPLPARTVLSTAEKSRLLRTVMRKRYEKGV